MWIGLKQKSKTTINNLKNDHRTKKMLFKKRKNRTADDRNHKEKNIDALEKEKGDKNTAPASEEKQRLLSIAQDKLEEACMFAVKALYTK